MSRKGRDLITHFYDSPIQNLTQCFLGFFTFPLLPPNPRNTHSWLVMHYQKKKKKKVTEVKPLPAFCSMKSKFLHDVIQGRDLGRDRSIEENVRLILTTKCSPGVLAEEVAGVHKLWGGGLTTTQTKEEYDCTHTQGVSNCQGNTEVTKYFAHNTSYGLTPHVCPRV